MLRYGGDAMNARHAAAALVICALTSAPALGCTTVCLFERERAVVAYNYDFYARDGLILVNKRGVTRTSWRRSQPAAWTAAHGSVTFNQFGRDNPTTGLNEKGLMVSLMWLDEAVYPPADARPTADV